AASVVSPRRSGVGRGRLNGWADPGSGEGESLGCVMGKWYTDWIWGLSNSSSVQSRKKWIASWDTIFSCLCRNYTEVMRDRTLRNLCILGTLAIVFTFVMGLSFAPYVRIFRLSLAIHDDGVRILFWKSPVPWDFGLYHPWFRFHWWWPQVREF